MGNRINTQGLTQDIHAQCGKYILMCNTPAERKTTILNLQSLLYKFLEFTMQLNAISQNSPTNACLLSCSDSQKIWESYSFEQ